MIGDKRITLRRTNICEEGLFLEEDDDYSESTD